MLGFIKYKDTEGIRIGRQVISFTLIEAVMVIVIIGILVVVAMPRFKVYYQIRLQSAAKRLCSDIRYTQSVAISKHTDTKIVFDDINDNYQAFYYDSDSNSWHPIQDPFTRLDLTRDFHADSEYKGIDISSVDINGTDTLKFNWWGTPEDGNSSALSLEGLVSLAWEDESIAVKITPQTGKVDIE